MLSHERQAENTKFGRAKEATPFGRWTKIVLCKVPVDTSRSVVHVLESIYLASFGTTSEERQGCNSNLVDNIWPAGEPKFSGASSRHLRSLSTACTVQVQRGKPLTSSWV